MYEEKDYVLRLIRESIRMVAKIAFGKDIDQDDDEALPLEVVEQHRRLSAMIEDGEINEAENMLLDNLDAENMGYFQMALQFYQQLNEKSEEYLNQHNFSKEEILDGIKYVVNFYGYGNMMEAFMEDYVR